MSAGTGARAGTGPPDDERLAYVALARLVEPGRRDLGVLVTEVGAVEALRRVRAGAVPAEVREAVEPRLRQGDPWVAAAGDVAAAARVGARYVTPVDPGWPAERLEGLRWMDPGSDPHCWPPLCLWVRGPVDLARMGARGVAVVGARSCTPYGTHVAAEIGFGMAERGWTVVSGGAFGIDAAAHRGALAVDGGTTVGVFAGGLDRLYPAGHAGLFEQIAAGGGLVSEWAPGAAPARHRFLIRNRVIAALSAGTVVVEAALRSGARSTVNRALALGRPVGVVPGPVTSAASAGCHQILRDGGATLVRSAADVAELLGPIGAEDAPSERGADTPRDLLGPVASRVLDALPTVRPALPDEIAGEAALPVREVRRTLPSLVAADLVEDVGGRYRLSAAARRDAGRNSRAAGA